MAGSRGGEASAAETVPRVRADASVLRAERRTISLVAAVSSIPLPHDLRPPLQCRDCYVSFMQDSHVRLSGTPPMNLRARFGACRPEERSRQLVIRRRDFRLLPAKLKRTQQTHAPSDGVGCCSRDDTSDSAESSAKRRKFADSVLAAVRPYDHPRRSSVVQQYCSAGVASGWACFAVSSRIIFRRNCASSTGDGSTA